MASLLTLSMLPSTFALRPESGDTIAGSPADAWALLGDGSTDIHINAPGNPIEYAISSDNVLKAFLLDGANDALSIAIPTTYTELVSGITPVDPDNFTTKDYVDNNIPAGEFVLKAGDTMTGQLVGITPVDPGDFTRKDYVDAADLARQLLSEKGANSGYCPLDAAGLVPASLLPVTNITFQGGWDASGNTLPPAPSGGDLYIITVAGILTVVPADGSSSTPVATIVNISDEILFSSADGFWYQLIPDFPTFDIRYVQLAGSTMSGQLVGITPVSAGDMTRKDYVDQTVADSAALKVSIAGDTMTGQLAGITPVAAEDLTRKDYVDASFSTFLAGFADDGEHIDFGGDLDSINVNSVYSILGSDVTNAPSDFGSERGILTTNVDSSGNGISNQFLSGLTNTAKGKVWMRNEQSSIWEAWALISDGQGLSFDSSNQGLFAVGAFTLAAQITAANALTRKDYVDGQDALQVSKTGDSMTGQLTLPGAGVGANAAQVVQISDAITVHDAAVDPHTVYQLRSEEGVPNGYCPLNASGLVPVGLLPVTNINFQGGWDASGNLLPGSPSGGDLYIITVAGTLNVVPADGSSATPTPTAVSVGDEILFSDADGFWYQIIPDFPTLDVRYVQLAGSTMTGQLTLPGGGIGLDAATVDDVNNSALLQLNLTGGAMSGSIEMANNTILRWRNVANTNSDNFGIFGDTLDNLQFGVPASGSQFIFNFTGSPSGRLVQSFGGLGLFYQGESSADQGDPGANNGVVYTKDVSGETQLFFRNNTEVIQITGVPEAGGLPSGTTLVFYQAAPPTGWTQDTSQNDKAIRTTSGTGGSVGGTVPFETAFANQPVSGVNTAVGLSIAQMPAHTHSTHSDGPQYGGAVTGVVGYPPGSSGGATGSQGSGSTHNHTFTGTAINLDVQFINVIIAVKD